MDNGIAIIIVAVIAAIPSMITAIRLWRVPGNVKEVKKGIDTYNETTIGINSATALTESIEAKPYPERTAQEQRHLDSAPPPDPPQGPR